MLKYKHDFEQIIKTNVDLLYLFFWNNSKFLEVGISGKKNKLILSNFSAKDITLVMSKDSELCYFLLY